uniref:Uncharacterized kinetoplast minicircle 51 polypeptide n=1 Tax=Trypanosoma brucei brucei TaxID=5702 RepID=YKM2_TRYBB|nr:RecName: Full=Uncharacterized kinetoplast minicircle 51 polypeptide [Trypanosoma brucei brucei]CAA24679.1 unnamed protein product [Trypanosoma brucei]
MGVQKYTYTNPVLFWGIFEVRGTSKGVGVILTRFFWVFSGRERVLKRSSYIVILNLWLLRGFLEASDYSES